MFKGDVVFMNPAPAMPVLRKLLVVDDNPIIQWTVYFALRDKGFLVLMAGTIADGLNLIHQQKPELVLLDLNFPSDSADFGGASWDGFAAMEWLRHTGDCDNIPIIVISETDPEVSRPRALAAGAAAYLPKPFERHQLLASVFAALGKSTAKAPDQTLHPQNSRSLKMA
jgi:CheY-like chemotaxis protein